MKYIKKLLLETNIQKIENNLPDKSINKNLIQIGTVIIFNNGNGVMRGIVSELREDWDEWIGYNYDENNKEVPYQYDLVVNVNENDFDYNYTISDSKISSGDLDEYHVSYNEIIKIESNSKLDSVNKYFKRVNNNENDISVLGTLIKNNFENKSIENVFNGNTFVSKDFIICLFNYLKAVSKIKFN